MLPNTVLSVGRLEIGIFALNFGEFIGTNLVIEENVSISIRKDQIYDNFRAIVGDRSSVILR